MRIVHSPQSIVHSKNTPTSYEPRATSCILAALFLACLILPLSAQAATYYVATSGNDVNPGTLSVPFRTIQKGIDTVKAGDTLYVRVGTYFEAIEITNSGTAEAPIHIAGYPGERPVLDGKYELPYGNPLDAGNGKQYLYGPLVVITGNYVVFEGFEVMRSFGRGIQIAGNTQTQVKDCWTHENRCEGILVYKSENILVENCRVWGNSDYSIPYHNNHDGGTGGLSIMMGSYITVRGNVVFENRGEGIEPMHSGHITIEDNVSYNNATGNIYSERSFNVVVQRNLVYCSLGYNAGLYVSGIGFADEAEDTTPITENVTVINNIVMGCCNNFFWWESCGEATPGGLKNSLIAYNTFVNARTYDGNQPAGIGIGPGVHTNCRIENNIILQDEGPIDSISVYHNAEVFSNNLWSRKPTSPVASSSTDIIADPQLAMSGQTGAGLLKADYFKIKESSLARNSATVIAEVPKDYFGNLRGSAPDIGAHEYTQTILYGDVSGDGEVSAYDAALTAQAAVGLITLTAEQVTKADVSGDTQVTAYDAALIAQRAVGLINKFPVEP